MRSERRRVIWIKKVEALAVRQYNKVKNLQKVERVKVVKGRKEKYELKYKNERKQKQM